MKKRLFAASIFLISLGLIQLYAQTKPDIQPQPGIYAEDTVIRNMAENIETEYRFSGADSEWLIMKNPLHLSAAPGERREYSLAVRWTNSSGLPEEEQYRYVIDKQVPAPPEASVPSGFYSAPQEIELSAPEGTILYSFSPENGQGEWSFYSPVKPIQAAPRGEYRFYTLMAYTVDDAGNKSGIREWKYIFELPETVQQERFNVISPKPGQYYNPQLLYIDTAGANWVRYSVNGTEEAPGTDYEGPVMLDVSGEVTVKVSASFKNNIITKTVKYDCQNRNVTGLYSGVVSDKVTIPALGDLHYNFNDSPVKSEDPLLDEPLRIEPQEGGVRPLVIRFGDEESEREYRYTFILHGKRITPPAVHLFAESGQQLTTGETVYVSGPFSAAVLPRPGTTSVFSVTEPSGAVREWRSNGVGYPVPFHISNPEEGPYIFRAKSIDLYGKESPFIEKTAVVDLSTPAAPVITLTPGDIPGIMYINADTMGENGSLLVSGGAGIEPALSTAEYTTAVPLSYSVEIPRGMEKDFTFRFALRDRGGNTSQLSETKRFSLDLLPPARPEISISGDSVTIQGSEEIFYKITSDLAEDSGVFQPYVQGFELPGTPGMRIAYQVTAYGVDENGNRSDTAAAAAVIDKRKPVLPKLSGVTSGEKYQDPVTISFEKTVSDITVSYTYTSDGSEPADPTVESPEYSGPVTFQGVKDKELHYRIKFLPHLNNPQLSGDITEISFKIDQLPPKLPEIKGITHNESYSGNRLITLIPDDPEDSVFYVIGEPGMDVTDPVAEGTYYNSPIHVSAEPDTESTYFLHLAVQDTVGNITYSLRPTAFTIDRAPPKRPDIDIFPSTSEITDPAGSSVFISSEPVKIMLLENSTDTTFFYTVSKQPGSAGNTPKRYHDPVVIEGEPGNEHVVYFSAYSRDSVGNESPLLGPVAVIIDRKHPEVPPEPVASPLSGGVSLSWPVINDAIYFKDNTSETYRLYTAPVMLSGSESEISYYAADRAGNKTDVYTYKIPAPGRPAPPVLTGVEDGKNYEGAVQVAAEAQEGIVRYEIGTHLKPPGDVSLNSPVLNGKLRIDALPGETVTYSIKAKRYNFDAVSSDTSIVFTIDRTIPPPPLILDRTSEYDPYSPTKVYEITAPEGKPFVKVVKNTETDSEEFSLYKDPIVLEAEKGQVVRFTIQAYSQDEAGNRSDIISREVILDQEIIYVSNRGSQDGDGTKTLPFQDLGEAIDYAFSRKRSNIYVAEGDFTLSRSITGSAPLIITGGFSADDWEAGSGETILTIPDLEKAPFQISENSFQLKNLTLNDTRADTEIALISSGGSDVKLENCRVTLPASRLINISSGNLEIAQTRITGTGKSGGSCIDLRYGTLRIGASEINIKGEGNTHTIIRLTGSGDSVLTDTSLMITGGDVLTGIKLDGSGLSMENSGLSLESAGKSAVGIESRDSRLNLTNSELSITGQPLAATLILSYNGVISGTNSALSALGKRNTTVIYARSGIVDLTGCRIESVGSSNSVYTVQCIGTVTNLTENTISSKGQDDTVGLVLKGSHGTVSGNVITIQPGEKRNYGTQITGEGKLELTDNTIISETAAKTGTALFLDSPNKELNISGNVFNGWEYLLTATASDSVVWKPEQAAVAIRSARELNNYVPPDTPVSLVIQNNSEE
ncbi:MAG: Ig-like domain repeat protein [Spirochaetia bacterium]